MGAGHPIQAILDKLKNYDKKTNIIMCGPKGSGKSSILYGYKIADV